MVCRNYFNYQEDSEYVDERQTLSMLLAGTNPDPAPIYSVLDYEKEISIATLYCDLYANLYL